jgi:hypothetical protein
MKRILATLAFAVVSAPALAAETGLPFEQTQFDRGVYSTGQKAEPKAEHNASAGDSRTQDSVWANDHNFIAPAQ